jgi:hypothetical protein
VTLCALVADAPDRSHSTSITSDALVNLISRLVSELTIGSHKLSVADCLDFFLDNFSHLVRNTFFFCRFYRTRLFSGQILSRLLFLLSNQVFHFIYRTVKHILHIGHQCAHLEQELGFVFLSLFWLISLKNVRVNSHRSLAHLRHVELTAGATE